MSSKAVNCRQGQCSTTNIVQGSSLGIYVHLPHLSGGIKFTESSIVMPKGAKIGKAVWAFRTLAFGSTAAVSYHMIPIMDGTPPAHAVQLTRADSPQFAAVGVNRVARQASRGKNHRDKLLKQGAMEAMADALERGDQKLFDAAGDAVEVLMEDKEGAHEAVADRRIVEALMMEGERAERLWKKVLKYEEIRKKVHDEDVCNHVMKGGSDTILGVLKNAGGC